MRAILALLSAAPVFAGELLSRKEAEALGITWHGNSSKTLSHHHLGIPRDGFPDAFSWCDKDGVNYCSPMRNQHIPQYCGSCWAHATVSALEDRLKIARGAVGPDIRLSTQHVLNCGTAGSCHGGSHEGVYQWLHEISESGTGLSYESSNSYLACSSESEEGVCPGQDWSCSALNVARTCAGLGQQCVGLNHYPNATIADYGHISGKEAMQEEIYSRGPIACLIAADDIRDYESGIASGGGFTDHVVSVVGWGADAQEGLYWIVRNSWGEYWGEAGFVRVKSGALQLEQSCVWATLGDYTAPEKENQFHCHEDGLNCADEVEPKLGAGKPKSELLSQEEVEALGWTWQGNSSASSHHLFAPTAGFPDAFTWCDRDGVNYCTPMRNQHIPQYCGSCWAHATLSALQDRIKIVRGAKAQGPDILLSVQHVLSCAGTGSCHGGFHGGVYQWIQQISNETGSGVSYESSSPYMACSSNSDEGMCPGQDWTCTALNAARTCGTFGEACVGLSHYPNATVVDYGFISGKDAMQQEIFNRGPISCNVWSDPLRNYEGGIVNVGSSTYTDHVVSVVGWGRNQQHELYWVVRNSWGEYWGESGFARVESGSLNLEQNCFWAVPGEFTAPEKDNQFHCHEDGNNCGKDASFVV